MLHKSYDEIVQCYSDYATIDDMIELSRMTSEYIDHPYDKDMFLDKVEKLLSPFLCEKDAKHYVSCMKNEDGTNGEHWTYEQIRSSCDRLGIPMNDEMYREWDMYTAANMIWSDLYDSNKPVEMYLRDAHRYLNDKDFPRPGKIKWYLNAKHKLEEYAK